MSSLSSFLAANPGLDLKTADLFAADAPAQYNLPPGTDPKALLQSLRIRQRLLKVYPDNNVAEQLETLGFHSAHHIASVDGNAFTETATPALATVPGVTDAAALSKKILGNAARIRRTSFELALAKPRTTALVTNELSVAERNPDFQQGTPDYERLFGPMLTCDCDECQSIFGPAAYFTDLMRIVTNYITPPLETLFTLQYRRPDLWTLPLNCLTSNTEVAYIDIVNAILQQHIATNYTGGADPMALIAASVYPFTAPFNQSLQTIGKGLEELNTGLPQLYQVLETPAPATASALLHLSPEQLVLVSGTGTTTLPELYGFHDTGISDAALCEALSRQKTFLQQTGLVPEKLQQLVYQNLTDAPGGYSMYDDGSHSVATTGFTDATLAGTITVECWIYPTSFYSSGTTITGKNSSGEFFLGLTSSGNVTAKYGDTAESCTSNSSTSVVTSAHTVPLHAWTHVCWVRNMATGINTIYLNGKTDFAGTPANPCTPAVTNCPIGIGYCSETSFYGAITELRIWKSVRTEAQIAQYQYLRLKDYTNPDLYAYWPLNENSGSTFYDLGPHGYNAPKGVTDYYASLPLTGPGLVNPQLAHGLYLNNILSSNSYLVLTDADYEQKTPAGIRISNGSSLSLLDDAALQQLAVFIRLQAQTGWSFEELDWLLKSVAGSQQTVNNAVIENLGIAASLLNRYDIRIDELSAFWYDMKTYGRGSDAVPQDLWDRVYNTPPLMAGSTGTAQPDYYRPVYSLNPLFNSPVITWTISSDATAQDLRLNSQLAAALNISGADLAAILNALAPGEDTVDLDVPFMSNMYRIARMAQMLSMKVDDLIWLVILLDLAWGAPLAIQDVLKIADTAEWLKQAGLTVSQLNYLTTGKQPADTVPLSDTAAFNKAMTDMLQSAQQVRIKESSFINDTIDTLASEAIFNQLVAQRIVTEDGVVAADPVTIKNIGDVLYAGETTREILFKVNPSRKVIAFGAQGGSGSVVFPFYPFSDPTIQSNNSFTISFWGQVNNINGTGWPMFTGNRDVWDIYNLPPGILLCSMTEAEVPGSVRIEEGYNGKHYSATVPVFTANNEWVFISWVNDAGNWRLYANGEEVGAGKMPQNVPGIYQLPQSQSAVYYAGYSFSGYIANLSIWKTARTGNQVMQDMYTDFSGTEDGLLAYWPMNEGTGVTINNISPGGDTYNGTFSGTPVWVDVPDLPAAREVLSIWQKLVNAKIAQETLVVKTLAGVTRTSAQDMAGISWLTSGLVNNAVALGHDGDTPYPYQVNFLLVTDPAKNPQRNYFLQTLERNTALAKWFRLNGLEAAAVMDLRDAFGTNDLYYDNPLLSLTQLQTISSYKYLLRYCKNNEGLLLYFIIAQLPYNVDADFPGIVQNMPGRVLHQYMDTIYQWKNNAYGYLSYITGWNEEEINAIVQQTYFPAASFDFKTVAGVQKLAAVFTLEEKTGMDIASLNLVRDLSADDLFTSAASWTNYLDAAAAVNGALDAKLGTAAVEKVRAGLNAQTRNVLCDWLIWELQTGVNGVKNYDELYEYLLIDVNMAPTVKVSWMVAGMNSLQLYVNRCINNMEPGIDNRIPERWWEWMSTYRVWQANREVYLYPENYADPTLRKFQSPQFAQFIDDVSKGQITDENVRQALAGYLDSINDVSSLELIDGYVAALHKGAPGISADNEQKSLFLVARSRTEPYSFYSRVAVAITSKEALGSGTPPDEATEMNFGPWEEINLQINSEYVSTIAAFGRQFIFWAEQTKIVNTTGDNKKYTTVTATVCYSYRDFSETWIAPVVLKKDIIIDVYGKELQSTMNYYADYLAGSQITDAATGHQRAFYKLEAWKKLRLQFIPGAATIAESIMVSLGDIVICDPSATSEPAHPDYTHMPDEQVVFQQQLYLTAKHTYANKTYYFTILEATLLLSSLRQKPAYPAIHPGTALLLEGNIEHIGHQAQLSFAATSMLSGVPLPDRVSWWPGIDNYGLITGAVGQNGTVKDIAGNHNGTALIGIPYVVDIFPALPDAAIPQFTTATYYSFDWSVNKSDANSTISFWLNLTSIDSNGDSVLVYPSRVSSVLYLQSCIVKNNKLYVLYYLPGSSTLQVITVPVSTNNWYFVTIVKSTSDVKIYFNGVVQTTATATQTASVTQDSSMRMGYFNGYGFGLQYWNISLSAAEVKQAYNHSAASLYLSQMHHSSTSLYRLGNSAGTFAFNTGNQAYLAFPNISTKTIAECLQSSYYENSELLELTFHHSPLPSGTTSPPMRFVRMNTDTVPELIAQLAADGLNALYDPAMQYLSEDNLDKYQPSSMVLLPETDIMSFNGAFGLYFWELFFYAPYLIAEKLRTGNKYADAEKWFRYIFNPSSVQYSTQEKWYDFLFNPDSETGPVAIWPMNKATGNQFADLKGDMPVTFTNLTEATGQKVPFAFLDRALWTFSSSPASTATTPYNASLNTPEMTVTAWVKLTAAPTENYSSIVNSQADHSGYHLAFRKATAGWTLDFIISATAGGKTGYIHAASYTLYTLNEWQFVAGRYNGKTLKVYINGEDVTQDPEQVTNYVPNATAPFRIGCGSSATTSEFYFNGQIADVAVFNYPVHGRDIRRLYENYTSIGPNAQYWHFRPFQRINATSLYHILNGTAWEDTFLQPAAYYTASLQMALYEYDPFDPDTIARLRVNSWQKATFMHYVENLVNWGDSLFTQDTWETLSDATMRYVLAATLLGRRPVQATAATAQPTVTYQLIENEYGPANVPPFLIDMENELSDPGGDVSLEQQVQSIIDAYFCVPANQKLLGYWDLVADRLFKLRHGLTITGAPNIIPLYAPAIDPAALVAASATGDLGNASSVGNLSVPWYRFSYMIAQARSAVGEVVRLGGELLAALEKKDAEQLAQMQAGYQEVIFNMTAQIRADQVNQLQYQGQGLQASYANAEHVHNTYRDWMIVPVGPLEAKSLELGALSIGLNLLTTDFDALAGVAYLLPTIFGLADGGMDFGDSTESAGKAIQSLAHISGQTSQLLAQMGQYVRRELEWNLQRTIAGNQMKEIAAQIKANDFALQAAQQEAALNQVQLQQSQEIYHFLKTKFTNEALYNWLSGQLSGLYFQMFQLAWSLAQNAQAALQYELNLDHTYLSNAAWNAAYQGLLGGDALMLALQQMENAYINGNKRKLEIRKTWSMRQHNPQALLTLVATGSCYFDLNELSYALDFPGHYNRKIKSLSVTIPAVVGPYQNLHATLVQTGNAVVTKPSVSAAQYMMGLVTTAPNDGSLRVNRNPNQEIIISTGINDAGMFQVNFNDEQYLPFEGTGAVSSWQLSMPQAANAFPLRSVSDVIITIDYTAEDGGSTYASQITALPPLTHYNGYQYLSLRQLYSAAWFSFCNNTTVSNVNSVQEVSASLAFELVPQMYPANLSNLTLGSTSGTAGLVLVTAANIIADGLVLQLNDGAEGTWPLPDYLLAVDNTHGPVAVPGKGNPWTLSATDIPAALLTTDNTIDQAKLQDIILIIPFSGTLNW